ncbi:hypothetical protein SPRG_20392 [Saprolegnia parasitica CBS 223.65]|uniref:ApaG domain-containing protein n=1 Tax=Saprolegnia parasitica (strain CBS 223.65) TaxID=695850 RepID=A0A067CAI2_SAPPC|nr:hypothetical protein SPRG_20392 [Saprolegnia parasitica CBS 223.65]KDO27754.1 hypothetical protein SPRG_20392 [Saprolegnia parasitica CBS 223.65]|eukprot:XP_012201622.1 hypothetical protein SPRG_20392 [Saprolegnia parasitica CBS 223.65]
MASSPDVLHLIFEYLDDHRDWVRAGCVCQRWRQVATSNRLWLPLLHRYCISPSASDVAGANQRAFAVVAAQYPGHLDIYAAIAPAVSVLRTINPSVAADTAHNAPFAQLLAPSGGRRDLWRPEATSCTRAEKLLLMLYHLFTNTSFMDMQLCCAALFGFFVCYNDVYALHLKRRWTVDVLSLSTQPFETILGFAWAPGIEEGLGLVLDGTLAGHVIRYGKALGQAHRMGPIPMGAVPYEDLGPFETWLGTFVSEVQSGVRAIVRANETISAPSGFREAGPGVGDVTTHGINVHVSTLFLLNMARVTYRVTFTFRDCKYTSMQLTRRHWTFRYTDGQASEVDGDGVVGYYPLLSAATPDLASAVASLEGYFEFVPGSIAAPLGPALRIAIPFVAFQLPQTALRNFNDAADDDDDDEDNESSGNETP